MTPEEATTLAKTVEGILIYAGLQPANNAMGGFVISLVEPVGAVDPPVYVSWLPSQLAQEELATIDLANRSDLRPMLFGEAVLAMCTAIALVMQAFGFDARISEHRSRYGAVDVFDAPDPQRALAFHRRRQDLTDGLPNSGLPDSG